MAKGIGGSTTLLVLGVLVVGFGIYLFTGKKKGHGHHKGSGGHHKKAFFVTPSPEYPGLGGNLWYPETSDVSLLHSDY